MPDPPSPKDPPSKGRPFEDDSDVLTQKKPEVKKPRRYRVLLHNDDYTTMEFVVHILMKFFQRTHSESTAIMLSVHQKGIGVAGVYPRDTAETKVTKVSKYARDSGHPLQITLESE